MGTRDTSTGEAKLRPESPDPGEVHVGKRVTRSRRGPGVEQSHQIEVKSRWGGESPDPGEAQVGTTVTRSRVVSGADQNHQV